MRRAWMILPIWLVLSVCAHAQNTTTQKIVLGGPQCQGAAFSADFIGGVYCKNGATFSNLLSVPGVSFARSTVESCQWADGHLTTAAVNTPCVTDLGLGIWEQRTNSFLNSAVGVTQAVTTTAAAWTLSLYGTGSITLSGNCAGTLNGTGANNRVALTATCTAGATTVTVTGSTTNVQFEAGAFATPLITTTGTTVTRTNDVGSISGPFFSTPFTATVSGLAPPASASLPAYNPRLLGIIGTGGSVIGFSSTTGADSYDGSVEIATANTAAPGVRFKAAMSQGSTLRSLAMNGGTVVTSASVLIAPGSLALGFKGDNTTNFADTYISAIAVSSGAAQGVQLQALSK